MFNSSDQLYTGGKYYEQNPGWHEEGSKYKAEVALHLIKQFQLPLDSVVDVGCGAGAVLSELAKHVPPDAQLAGYDISPDAIKIAKQKATSRLNFYVEDYSKSTHQKAGLVLVLDVVEHIDDVYNFLRRLQSKGENFIFHIPLDMSCRTLLKPHTLLQQRRQVGHIHYFTEEVVLWMLGDTGYDVKYYTYTMPEVDLVKPRSFKQWTKKMLRRISYNVNRKLSVKLWGNYSLMIWATPTINETNESNLAV